MHRLWIGMEIKSGKLPQCALVRGQRTLRQFGSSIGTSSQAGKTKLKQRKRIVFTTFGSLGDLYPYHAIAWGICVSLFL